MPHGGGRPHAIAPPRDAAAASSARHSRSQSFGNLSSSDVIEALHNLDGLGLSAPLPSPRESRTSGHPSPRVTPSMPAPAFLDDASGGGGSGSRRNMRVVAPLSLKKLKGMMRAGAGSSKSLRSPREGGGLFEAGGMGRAEGGTTLAAATSPSADPEDEIELPEPGGAQAGGAQAGGAQAGGAQAGGASVRERRFPRTWDVGGDASRDEAP